MDHVLWRQDDDGNRVRIGAFATLAEAEAAQTAFEAGGHKQLFWIESPAEPTEPIRAR